MPVILHKSGAQILDDGRERGFPATNTHGMYLVEEAGELVPYINHPDGTRERVPGFYAAQRAQGIHWLTDPTYGAVGDGTTDDTAAIKAAIAACSAQGGGWVKAPANFTMLVSHTKDAASAIDFPDGVSFQGGGYSTVFKQSTTGYTANGTRYTILYGSNSVLRGFRFDGQRASVTPGAGVTSVQHLGIYARAEGVHDVVIEDVWVHGIYALGGEESFGPMTRASCYNITFRNGWGWDCDGTPFHFAGQSGAMPTALWNTSPTLATDLRAENLRLWDNTWQGISCYGVKRVELHGITATGNLRGINLEWVDTADVFDCVGYENVRSGLGTWGGILNLRVHGGAYYHNNTDDQSWLGDLHFGGGAWYTGTARGILQTAELRGVVIAPRDGNAHIRIKTETASTVTYEDETGAAVTASSVPTRFLIDTPDAADWRVLTENSETYLVGAVQYASTPQRTPLAFPALADWTKSGSLSTQDATTAGITGHESSEAVRVTAVAQYENLRTDRILLPYRHYLVEVRVKPLGTDAWEAKVQGASATPIMGVRLPVGTMDVGQWVEPSFIVTTGSEEAQVLVVNGAATPASALDVDYVRVTEIGPATGAADRRLHHGRRAESFGTAAPTTGTWNRGDIVWNTAPTSTSAAGWICVTAGTPGTWVEFAHIDADPAVATLEQLTVDNDADASNSVRISSGATAAQTAELLWQDRGSSVWGIAKNAAGQFIVYDFAAGKTRFSLSSSGAIVSPGAVGQYFTIKANDNTDKARIAHETGIAEFEGGARLGASGTATTITQVRVYAPALTPASVGAGTVAEQTFTVTGLATTDKVIVNPPAIGNASGIVGARVSAADTLAIRFVNPTAGALTPTAGTYTVLAFRS